MRINLLPHQYDFLTNKAKFAALVGGIGFGKTFALSHYVIGRVAKFPKALHFIGANTYSQLRNSTLPAVFSSLNDLKIPFSYNQSSGYLEFLGGKVLCKSMENFNMLRGIEIGSFILDEARDTKKEAFDMLMGRLRDKNAKEELQGRIVTSPSGYNWIYDYFHPNGEFNNNSFEIVTGTSFSNRHLPDGYIDSLKEQYSDTFFKQEIMGEFINLTAGKVYYAFDRDKNVAKVKKVHGTSYVGLDFNVHPLCGVIGQFYNGMFHISDELFLENADTYMASDALMKKGYGGAVVIPDSTGKNRKTSGKSDFNILKEYGFRIEYTHNPIVFDRVNNVNRLLSQGRIIIDPRCKKLINDLEKVSWKDNKLDQQTDKMLTHITDALGYMCYKLDPIRDNIKPISVGHYR